METFVNIVWPSGIAILLFLAVVESPKVPANEVDHDGNAGVIAACAFCPVVVAIMIVVGIGSLFYIAFNGWRDNTNK